MLETKALFIFKIIMNYRNEKKKLKNTSIAYRVIYLSYFFEWQPRTSHFII